MAFSIFCNISGVSLFLKYVNEVESIIKSVNKIDEVIESGQVEAHSLEGLLDKKAKLLQVLGTYTGKTKEKTETEVTYDVGELSRHLIEQIEAKEAAKNYTPPNRTNITKQENKFWKNN